MSAPPPPPPPKVGRPISQNAPPPPPPPPPRRASTGAPPPPGGAQPPVGSPPAAGPPPPPHRPPQSSSAATPPPPPVREPPAVPPPPNRPATPPPTESAPAPPSRPPPPVPPVTTGAPVARAASPTPSYSTVNPPHSQNGADVALEGLLSKRNREGAFDKCYVVLTPVCIRYGKAAGTSAVASISDKLTSAVSRAANVATSGSVGAAGNVSAPTATAAGATDVKLSESATEIAIETVLATPLQPGDYDDAAKAGRTFRFQSKHKSFLLRAKTEEEAALWLDTLQRLSREARRKAGLREPTDNDVAPLWATNATANACTLCKAGFTLFVRRHHCRNCGALVCESCSRERMRIPRLDEKQLFRVCNPCGAQLKDSRSYGAAASQSPAGGGKAGLSGADL